MGGVSVIFAWKDICMLSVVQETFCGIHGPQFDIEFGHCQYIWHSRSAASSK